MTARPGLYVDDNTGNGVTAPQDARLALASLLSGPGIISGTQGNVTGSSTGPNMIYSVPAESFVTQRGTLAADGLYLWANDGPVLVDSATPAPSSGKRYDLIWARHKNAYTSDGFSDADSLPELGVTVGTAASTPTKPYASVPDGALVLAESEVTAGNANAAVATITQVAPLATVKGAPIPVASAAERDALGLYPGLQVMRSDRGYLTQTWDGTAWDHEWINITGLGGSYSTPTNAVAQYYIANGVISMRGLIQRADSTNFPANTSVVLIAVGNLQTAITPKTMTINAPLAATNPAAFCRGFLTTNASLSILTPASPGSYVDLAGFSGYTAD